ncbi:MAG: hypothetical protein ACLPTZ_25440 [Beijerinckiaceae bacterium]
MKVLYKLILVTSALLSVWTIVSAPDVFGRGIGYLGLTMSVGWLALRLVVVPAVRRCMK